MSDSEIAKKLLNKEALDFVKRMVSKGHDKEKVCVFIATEIFNYLYEDKK